MVQMKWYAFISAPDFQNIGNDLQQLQASTCVGASFGYAAKHIDDDTTIYYVVVPWIVRSIPLDSFLK